MASLEKILRDYYASARQTLGVSASITYVAHTAGMSEDAVCAVLGLKLTKWSIRSKRTGQFHCRKPNGDLGFAMPSNSATPVAMGRSMADAAKRLLERKFKYELEIVECPMK